jgi:hypothetical protein
VGGNVRFFAGLRRNGSNSRLLKEDWSRKIEELEEMRRLP